MDPKEVLLRAVDFIRDGDTDEAYRLMEAYRHWRAINGFEPQIGGDLVMELILRLVDAIDCTSLLPLHGRKSGLPD